MSQYVKYLFIATCYCACISNVQAQLTKHRSFFKSNESSYQNWLQDNKFSDYIRFDSLKIEDDLVTACLVLPNKARWEAMQDASKKENYDLSFILWNELVYLCDLKGDQASIFIDTKDTRIFIDLVEGELLTDFQKKMGHGSSNKNFDPSNGNPSSVNSLSFNNTGSALSGLNQLTISGAKIRISEHFKKYFKQFEATLAIGKYDFYSYSHSNNDLYVEIKNIRNAVFDNGTFEYIRFAFSFSEKDGELNVSYVVGCKYGGGMFMAPHNDDYKDGSIKYKSSYQAFNNRMKGELFGLLNP